MPVVGRICAPKMRVIGLYNTPTNLFFVDPDVNLYKLGLNLRKNRVLWGYFSALQLDLFNAQLFTPGNC